jgi:hypothetical protein
VTGDAESRMGDKIDLNFEIGNGGSHFWTTQVLDDDYLPSLYPSYLQYVFFISENDNITPDFVIFPGVRSDVIDEQREYDLNHHIGGM